MEWQEFLQIFPKYSCFCANETASLGFLLQLAETMVGDIYPPAKRKIAIAFFVAHQIEAGWLQELDVASKASAVSAGSANGSLSPIDNDFATTYYGRQYLEIKKTIPVIGTII